MGIMSICRNEKVSEWKGVGKYYGPRVQYKTIATVQFP